MPPYGTFSLFIDTCPTSRTFLEGARRSRRPHLLMAGGVRKIDGLLLVLPLDLRVRKHQLVGGELQRLGRRKAALRHLPTENHILPRHFTARHFYARQDSAAIHSPAAAAPRSPFCLPEDIRGLMQQFGRIAVHKAPCSGRRDPCRARGLIALVGIPAAVFAVDFAVGCGGRWVCLELLWELRRRRRVREVARIL